MIPIQQLSRQTGITVRTLRYYDQIGLLIPSAKTEGNHRLYSEKQLMKLQQIQFLKGLGFSLQEISEMLSNPDWNWTLSLKNQLAYVKQEQEKLRQMESTLRGVLHSMVLEGETSMEVMQKLIQLSGKNHAIKQGFRQHMFEEREMELLQQLPNMNRDDPDSLEWIALVGQLNRHKDSSPDSPVIQRIVRRMDEKRIEQFGDEASFVNKLWDIRRSPEQSAQMSMYPMDKELLDLLEQAYDTYLSAMDDPEDRSC